MEFHVCILSTMTPEMTAANFKLYDIEYDYKPGCIQKIRWPRTSEISITLWLVHQHPVSDELLKFLLPYVDVSIVWYHDHQALSCLKVKNGVKLISRISNIWLASTQVPKLRAIHRSRVEKCYDSNGFLRPHCIDFTLEKNIEEILRSELKVQKKLYRF